MLYKYLIPLCIISASFIHGVTVQNANELNLAIIAANSGGPDIEFGRDITYSQVFHPLNVDRVFNPANQNFTIDGKSNSLIASGTYRGFFARTSPGNTITIQNLTISSAHAKGGDGGTRGGGGLGAGGALFLNTNSVVVLDNVSFQNCQATGGTSSGLIGQTVSGGDGGGGLGGDGGASTLLIGHGTGAGGGGGGFSERGGGAHAFGGGGGGGFNGRGGYSAAVSGSSARGGGGGGGGGSKGGFSNYDGGGGGAGNFEDGSAAPSSGDGSDGGRGHLPAGVGGTGAISGTNFSGGGGSGGSGATPGNSGNQSQGGSSSDGILGGGGGGGAYSFDVDLSTLATSTAGGGGGAGFGGGGSGASNTSGQTGDGGKGGFMGGGGGSGQNMGSGTAGNGGDGGDFGGGGGAGNAPGYSGTSGLQGGKGGFGGGGGGGGTTDSTSKTVTGSGGEGGFGAGGGGGATPATGGFGGGTGGVTQGGGGGAMGADIFIQNGATLTIRTGISFSESGNELQAGSGANSGTALGKNIFMMTEGQIIVENLIHDSIVPTPIESNLGSEGRDTSLGGLTLQGKNTATFKLSGANTYTGQTNIKSGILELGGGASVITPVNLDGGALAGNGSLLVNENVENSGNLTINGGVVCPLGLGYGTINVGKDLSFKGTGGTFLTDFDSVGNSNLLNVSGAATLADTIIVEKAIGNFLEGQTITLLTAENGITSTFDHVKLPLGADGLPLFQIQYTSDAVLALVLQDHVFVHPYIKPGNPRHVAKYIRDQLPINPSSDLGNVVRALGVLSDKELNKVLNMMHQGVFGTLEGMNLTTNAQIMQMFNQRFFRLSSEGEPETISYLEPKLTASTDDAPQPFYPNAPIRRGCERDTSKPHHVYFQPFGTWNTQSQKGELRGFQYENAGFLTGYDYLFHNFYVGAGLGYAYTNFRWSSSAGKGHIHQVYGGLHGSYFNRYFSAILGSMLGGNFYETNRHIIASAPGHPNGSLNRTAHSNNSGIQWTNHLGLIGDFSSLSVPLQIFANLDHFYLHNGSFNESGAGSINLRVNAKVSNALRSELGLSSSYTFHVSGGCWTPYARISWVNKTVLSNSTYRGGFRGQVGTFSASATTKGTNQWAPGVGVEFANTHGFSLLLNTRAEINGKMKNYSADMRMEYAF